MNRPRGPFTSLRTRRRFGLKAERTHEVREHFKLNRNAVIGNVKGPRGRF